MITENQANIDAGHAALAADDRRLGIRHLAGTTGAAVAGTVVAATSTSAGVSIASKTAATLAERYPRWDAFLAAREELDPAHAFTNEYAERVLGP